MHLQKESGSIVLRLIGGRIRTVRLYYFMDMHSAVDWRQDWSCFGSFACQFAACCMVLYTIHWCLCCPYGVGVVWHDCGKCVAIVCCKSSMVAIGAVVMVWSCVYDMLLWFEPVLSDAQDHGRFGQARTCCVLRYGLCWENDMRFHFSFCMMQVSMVGCK